MGPSSKDQPIVMLSISSQGGADEQLERALAELTRTDLSVSFRTVSTGEFVLAGGRPAQLQVICDRIHDEFHVAVNATAPKAVLLETIQSAAEAEGKYIRQTGGGGNYGHCWLRIEPSEPTAGYQFFNEITNGAVSGQYVRPIEEGVLSAMESGIIAGFPLVDVKVTLYDGSYHDVDSNEMAFRFAGSIAFKEAARKAHPVVLEPLMAIKVEVPEDLAAAIHREIRTYRGRVEREAVVNGFVEIEAVLPLSVLLASTPSGLALFPMEFARYEAVRDRDTPSEDGPFVPAKKPNRPWPGSRSGMVRPPEEE